MGKGVLVFLIAGLLLFGCKKEKEQKGPAQKQDDFKMYSMSEMAGLMEQMYVQNKRLKERIINGDTIGHFPEYYLRIQYAAMTDESDNDDFFKEHATQYLEAQKRIYNDTLHAKERFNAGVDACLSCHSKKCGGPVPRIKKLYIK